MHSLLKQRTLFSQKVKECASTVRECGGGKRTRTADICRAKAALYQLSYTPMLIKIAHQCNQVSVSQK